MNLKKPYISFNHFIVLLCFNCLYISLSHFMYTCLHEAAESGSNSKAEKLNPVISVASSGICCSLSAPAAALHGSLSSFCPSIPMWQSGLIWFDRPVSSTAHACIETSGRELKGGNRGRRTSEAGRLRRAVAAVM